MNKPDLSTIARTPVGVDERFDQSGRQEIVEQNGNDGAIYAAPKIQSTGCTKPGCFPYCDCDSVDSPPSGAIARLVGVPAIDRYDIQGGDGNGVYPDRDDDGEWCKFDDVVVAFENFYNALTEHK